MSRFVPYVRVFGDPHPNPFERRSMKAAIMVAGIAELNGHPCPDAAEVYTHLGRHRFRNPAAYGYTEGHRRTA